MAAGLHGLLHHCGDVVRSCGGEGAYVIVPHHGDCHLAPGLGQEDTCSDAACDQQDGQCDSDAREFSHFGSFLVFFECGSSEVDYQVEPGSQPAEAFAIATHPVAKKLDHHFPVLPTMLPRIEEKQPAV